MEAFEEIQFVIYVQNCVSAVDDVKWTFWKCPLSSVCHLKLHLRKCQQLRDILFYGCIVVHRYNKGAPEATLWFLIWKVKGNKHGSYWWELLCSRSFNGNVNHVIGQIQAKHFHPKHLQNNITFAFLLVLVIILMIQWADTSPGHVGLTFAM